MTRPDKRFASRIRSINDPFRMLGVIVRELDSVFPVADDNLGEILRRARRIYDAEMQARRRKRAAANRLCEECGLNPRDAPSRICAGCEAYMEHRA